MATQIIERELSAAFVMEHGGLINGSIPPGIHEDAYMADSYRILSCEPMVGKYAYKVVYEIENEEDTRHA